MQQAPLKIEMVIQCGETSRGRSPKPRRNVDYITVAVRLLTLLLGTAFSQTFCKVGTSVWAVLALDRLGSPCSPSMDPIFCNLACDFFLIRDGSFVPLRETRRHRVTD